MSEIAITRKPSLMGELKSGVIETKDMIVDLGKTGLNVVHGLGDSALEATDAINLGLQVLNTNLEIALIESKVELATELGAYKQALDSASLNETDLSRFRPTRKY